jgi:hypothetical protein
LNACNCTQYSVWQRWKTPQESYRSGSATGEVSAFGVAREHRRQWHCLRVPPSGIVYDAEALDCFAQMLRSTFGVSRPLLVAQSLTNSIYEP